MNLYEEYESILPPHWTRKKDGIGYLNEISGEESEQHPFRRFFETRNKVFELIEATAFSADPSPKTTGSNVGEESPWGTGENQFTETNDSIPLTTAPKEKRFDFRCEWKESNAMGQLCLFGLEIRLNPVDCTTKVRFDGIKGDWIDTDLHGPRGLLTRHDFFVGSRVEVFGRHLTISSASRDAARWIDREAARLMKQQEKFRQKILSVRAVPCVRAQTQEVIHHIERPTKAGGKSNLRKLHSDVAALGEQLAKLGLAFQL